MNHVQRQPIHHRYPITAIWLVLIAFLAALVYIVGGA